MHVRVEGKGWCAGPATEQKAKGGSSKKCKPSAKNTPACSRPENTLLLQRKVQQLEKQLRPFEAYTAGSNNQLLPSDNPNDISVVSYDSKGPVQHLNGKAKNKIYDTFIVCRHLAYAFATGCFGLKMNVSQGKTKQPGSKFNAVASVDKIRNNAAIKTDQQLQKTPVHMGIPRAAVYFDAQHIGQALYDVWMNKGAGDQAPHGKPSQAWLFSTENHVMAIKLMPTAGSAIKIEWYDSNYTTIVRRVIVLNEEILQQLTLSQFVSVSDQKSYAIDRGQAGILKSTDAVEVENDSDATLLSALTPSLLNLLMQHGQLNSSMDSLKTTLSEVWSDNPSEFVNLLVAETGDGTPGLYMALENGHQETVRAYVEGIKQLGDIIEPEFLKELIAAKIGDGTPGLFMALQGGHQEVISAYLESIEQFPDIIEPEFLKELLSAKNENGTPGLYMALQSGHQEAIRAYVEGIEQFLSIIQPEVLKELLAAKDESGTPGLFMALQEGEQEAVRAYVEGLERLGNIIKPEVIKELLAAKRGDGTLGLFIALQNGHQETIGAYVEGIKQLGGIIGPETIRELFTAKDERGILGLFMALQNGHQEAVRAYVEGLKQLRDRIEPEVIKELLAAKTGDGTPGLFMALQNGYQEVISTYLEGIMQFREIIEPEVLKELLAGKDKSGTPGLFMALQEGHQEAVRAYLEGIRKFGDIIEPGVLKELLAAKDESGVPGLFMAQQNGHQETVRAYVESIK